MTALPQPPPPLTPINSPSPSSSPSLLPANVGHRCALLNTLAANQEATQCKVARPGRCAEEASWTGLRPMTAGREAPETLTTSRRSRRQAPFTLCHFVGIYTLPEQVRLHPGKTSFRAGSQRHSLHFCLPPSCGPIRIGQTSCELSQNQSGVKREHVVRLEKKNLSVFFRFFFKVTVACSSFFIFLFFFSGAACSRRF